jgi:hypothetical protein
LPSQKCISPPWISFHDFGMEIAQGGWWFSEGSSQKYAFKSSTVLPSSSFMKLDDAQSSLSLWNMNVSGPGFSVEGPSKLHSSPSKKSSTQTPSTETQEAGRGVSVGGKGVDVGSARRTEHDDSIVHNIRKNTDLLIKFLLVRGMESRENKVKTTRNNSFGDVTNL